jgi:hypothetical protein
MTTVATTSNKTAPSRIPAVRAVPSGVIQMGHAIKKGVGPVFNIFNTAHWGRVPTKQPDIGFSMPK